MKASRQKEFQIQRPGEKETLNVDVAEAMSGIGGKRRGKPTE